MRILHRYIFGALISTFITALLVLSFVLMIGLLFKATAFIASGATLQTVLQFLGFGFPGMLSLAIPISALIATLLLFNRLSADSETSAMRACGVSMHRIMLTPFLLGISLSALSFYINGVVAPNSGYARRVVRKIVKTSDILAVLQPGKSIANIPGMPPNASVFIRDREEDVLLEIRIQEPLPNGGLRDIKAREARIFQNTNGTVRLEMKDVIFSPLQENRPGTGQAESLTYVIGDKLAHADQNPPRRIKDLISTDLQLAIQSNTTAIADTKRSIQGNTEVIAELEANLQKALSEATPELLASLEQLAAEQAQKPVDSTEHGDDSLHEASEPPAEEHPITTYRRRLARRDHTVERLQKELTDLEKDASRMRTEAMSRIVLALASFCFIAVAAPLGLKSSRRESSIGTAISVGYGFFYYIVLITADSLAKYPSYHAEWLVWIPVLLGLVLAIRGICKNM